MLQKECHALLRDLRVFSDDESNRRSNGQQIFRSHK